MRREEPGSKEGIISLVHQKTNMSGKSNSHAEGQSPQASPESPANINQRNCNDQLRRNQVQEVAFEGECDNLKGQMYNVVSGKDKFCKTTRKIAEYIGQTFNDAGKCKWG